MKRLYFLLSILLIGGTAWSQAITQTGFVGKFTFQGFSAGGTADVSGVLDGYSDQTNQYFASNIQVGDVIWDNQGKRWEVMVVNSSNLLQADVDLRSVNGGGGTPVGVGFVSRETPNLGLSLFVPDNNIGISQQLKSRIESHNMLLIDQYVAGQQDSVFTGTTAADTSSFNDPGVGDVLVADNGDIAYYDGNNWVVSEGGGGADNLGNHTMTQALRTGGNLISYDGDPEGLYIDPEGRVGINTDQLGSNGLTVVGNIGNDAFIRPGIGIKNDLIYLAPTGNEINEFWYNGFFVLLHVAPPYVDGYSKDYANGTLYIKPGQFEEDFYAIDIQTLVDGSEQTLKGTINVRTMNGKYEISLVKVNYQGNYYAAIYFSNPSNITPPTGSFFSGIVSSNPPSTGFEAPMTIISADNASVDQFLAWPDAITDQDIIAHDYAYENRFRRVALGITSGGGTAVLDVSGDTRLRNELRDYNNSSGTPGQILSTTGVGVVWTDPPAGGSADGNGIYSGSGNIPNGTEATLATGGTFTVKDNAGNDRLRITENANVAITGTSGFTATTTSGILGLTHTGSSGQLIVQSQDERATFQGEDTRINGDTIISLNAASGEAEIVIKDNYIQLADLPDDNAPVKILGVTADRQVVEADLPAGGAGDNWGSQVVISDATLSGLGTAGSPLSVVAPPVTTAGNGLNDFDAGPNVNVQLGGPLLKSTTIDGDGGSYDFNVFNTDDLSLEAEDQLHVWGNNRSQLGITNGDAITVVSGDTINILPQDYLLLRAPDSLNIQANNVTMLGTSSGRIGDRAGYGPTFTPGAELFWSNTGTIELSARGQDEVVKTRIKLGQNYITLEGVPEFADDAAADAAGTLPSGGIYTVTGDRSIRIKP